MNDAAVARATDGVAVTSRPSVADWTINIDTGGTFTDGYVSAGDRSASVKVDTTPHDLAAGVSACLDAAAGVLGLSTQQLLRRTGVVRLSTTIGTNTLIARTGPRVGLLIGRAARAASGEFPSGLPLKPDLVEQIADDPGPADERAVLDAVHSLLERGARIIVVALDHGQDLARRELAVREVIASDYPRHYLGAVPVVPSH